jgi:ubiquinone/menaquinone biosynthesis C-methylase UbiE
MVHPNSQKDFWNNFSDTYAEKMEISTYQGSHTCFVMAGAQRPNIKICEVGCGSGLGSLTVATNMLAKRSPDGSVPGSVLVSSDFSDNFVRLAKVRYADSDYVQCPGNIAEIDAETEYEMNGETFDVEAKIAEKGDFRKMVIGCRASGTALPFKDGIFDAYVSNLVLMLIHDPAAQIREAYRVLKPGSRACFSVWGRRENSLNFTLEAMARKSLEEQGKIEPKPV